MKAAGSKPKKAKTKEKIGKGSSPRFLVGIGSSAGGLEALRALFGAFEEIPAMAFVVVQHLAPMHRSRLVEIIGHSTKLRVKEAEDGEVPESRVVYITPPNRDVFLEGGKIRLKAPQLTIGPKPSVDLFFRSLAEDAGPSAIGIILSGTGSDGAHGVRAIKAAGGFTISQKLDSAKYDGMPKAARQTGAIDLELAPEEIAAELTRFHGIKRKKQVPALDDPYEEILEVVERKVGASFSLYKQSTVRRRMDRRMIATRCESLKEYLDFINREPDEARNLFQDILISVTSFFRDAGSFRLLARILEERVAAKKSGESFRCWIIGCATGEEVYSVAILLAEAMEKKGKSLNVQIFATDLDDNALAIARKATYSLASFDEFPSALREKYFISLEDRFQVKSSIRDWVVFSHHNVTEDPPFLNMDLVSCRNVLIYFNQPLQEKVFRTMHYALAAKGLLFLGRSEAVPSHASAYFDCRDKLAKIYLRKDGKGELPKSFSHRNGNGYVADPLAFSLRKGGKVESAETALFRELVEAFAPDSVLLDEEFRVKHVFGRAAGFLSFSSGEASTTVTRLVQGEVGMELSTLLHRSARKEAAFRGRRHEITLPEGDFTLRLSVAPVRVAAKKCYIVSFELEKRVAEQPGAKKKGIASEKRIRSLERELAMAKEQLQSAIEQHETASEELQSLNEELQSANEELQSSNEELETTNEEMQSSNEELTTLNQELNVKSTELTVLNQRLQAIQNAIVYPLVTIDNNLHIVNFNPAARHLLKVTESDFGSHLRAVPTNIDLAPVTAAVEQSMKKRADTRLQYKTRDRTFEVQIQLYRSERGQVDGAVISFVENTEIASALEESRLIKGRLSSILDNTPAMVTMKDMSGVYVYVNQKFCELTGRGRDDLLGRTDEEIFGFELAKEIRGRDFEVLKQERPVPFDEKMEINGRSHFWTSAKFPLFDSKRRPYSLCTVSLEITERVARERQLELFSKAISSANSGTIILEDKGEGFLSTFCSGQFSSRLGFAPESLVGLGPVALLEAMRVKDRPDKIREIGRVLETESPSSVSLTVSDPKSGQEFNLEMRGALIQHGKDGSRHLILSIFDITQRARDQRIIAAQQEELTRFGRFSSLGEIAAGIAHEINTPLNVITTKTDILRKGVQLKRLKDDTVVKVAEDIDRVARNISSIVLGLKSVVGAEPEKFDKAIVQNLIRDTLKICEYRLQRFGVEVRTELPAAPISIDCYPVQIIQILINLINNSVDAVAELEDRWIKIHLADLGDKVEVVVTDSGDGIDAELAEKIMTPFFTTKKEKKGTGIGLSLSRSIARRHKGDLTVNLAPANTTFRLELAKAHK